MAIRYLNRLSKHLIFFVVEVAWVAILSRDSRESKDGRPPSCSPFLFAHEVAVPLHPEARGGNQLFALGEVMDGHPIPCSFLLVPCCSLSLSSLFTLHCCYLFFNFVIPPLCDPPQWPLRMSTTFPRKAQHRYNSRYDCIRIDFLSVMLLLSEKHKTTCCFTDSFGSINKS